MRLRALLALSAILGLAFAACSGGGGDDSGDDAGASSNKASGSIPDACSLLTPDQIKAQFGVPVAASPSGASECSWKPVDFSPQFGGVTLSVQEDAKGEFFEFTRSGAKDRIDVPGLGNAAFFGAPANPYTLWINGGEYLYTFYVVAAAGTPAENQQKVISLAKIALAK